MNGEKPEERVTPGHWKCKCVYNGIRVTHTTGTYCGQCDEYAPGIWKKYSGDEIGDGGSLLAKADGFEYDISLNRHGQIFLTVRMPDGFEWTSQSLRNVDTAKVGAQRHHRSFVALIAQERAKAEKLVEALKDILMSKAYTFSDELIRIHNVGDAALREYEKGCEA